MNQEEENSLTKEKENPQKEKENNEEDPLNTFEIIQFESDRPKPVSKNKYTMIIIFLIILFLIVGATLYFLNRPNSLFNEDLKVSKLKIRKDKRSKDKELDKEIEKKTLEKGAKK